VLFYTNLGIYSRTSFTFDNSYKIYINFSSSLSNYYPFQVGIGSALLICNLYVLGVLSIIITSFKLVFKIDKSFATI